MFKHLFAAAIAAALIAAPGAASASSHAKKLSPQQQKMKDCGAKWQAHKKATKAKGSEYRKFVSGCLKG